MQSDLFDMLRRGLAEPLVRFVVLGALIFAAHAALGPRPADAARHIEVGRADLERLRALSLKQWGRAPDAAQMNLLLQQHVREEILYREALASGLDRDDVIVRRRLAQKMEFLAQEGVDNPPDSALAAYHQAHAAQYARPASLHLQHLFFGTRSRGAGAQRDAERALAVLRAGGTPQGDPFMLGSDLRERTQEQLATDFGAGFASAVFALPPGRWSAPIASALGVHLVRVEARAPASSAPLDSVRERVRTDLVNERVAQARDAAYARLRRQYVVDVADAGLQLAATPVEARQP